VKEISIGEFARRSRLSLKALRLYDPADAAARIAEHWCDAEAAHDARRDLAGYLVSRLSGKRSAMYEVATREMPERSLLCLKRNVDEQGIWAFGKEFIAILRERPLPEIEGREGASFCIYWGWPSADSDGPVEWCRPVPAAAAHALAGHYPELTLRTEPAHREAFVALPGPGVASGVQIQLAAESLQAWAQEQEQGAGDEQLTLTPEDLGERITYLATGPASADCDFAVPFGVER